MKETIEKTKTEAVDAVVKDAVDKLRALWVDFLDDDDNETLHADAEDILLSTLYQLGANDVAVLYRKLKAHFWYS